MDKDYFSFNGEIEIFKVTYFKWENCHFLIQINPSIKLSKKGEHLKV
jgi:hypothetical protein